MALLMTLLSPEEEAKNTRKQVEDVRKKNKELLCNMKELNSSKFLLYSSYALNYLVQMFLNLH